jgi:hypothetical protein
MSGYIFLDNSPLSSQDVALFLNGYNAKFAERDNAAYLGIAKHVVQYPTVLKLAFDTENDAEMQLHDTLVNMGEAGWYATLIQEWNGAPVNSYPKIENHL